MKLRIPYFKQEKTTTCGPACLRMVMAFEGKSLSEAEIEKICKTSWLGNTCEDIVKGARKLGLESEIIENFTKKHLAKLLQDRHPVIALIDPSVLYGGIPGFGHFVLITGLEKEEIYYHDPDIKEDLSIKVNIFFSAWEKFHFKGVKVWKFMKR